MKYFPDEVINGIDGVVEELRVMFNVPGLSLSVIKDDELILKKSYGYRNLENKEPMTNETLIGIGSASKSFTALAVMILVQDKKINLNDPVSKYTEFNFGDNITIHHILSHSSGLPALLGAYIAINMLLGEEFTDVKIHNWEEWQSHMNNATNEIFLEPGKKWIYFNDGYTILQRVIENVSGQKYADFVQENILEPLEMKRSTFSKEKFMSDPDKMTAYFEGKPKEHPFTELLNASGGLLSDSLETLHFLQLFMNRGIYKDKRILSEDLIEKMSTIHIDTDIFQGLTTEQITEGYGYGLFIVENYCGAKLVYHSGNTSISSSNMLYIPDKKIGICALSNSGTGEPLAYIMPFIIAAIILGRNPEEVITSKNVEMKLGTLIGEYETYKGMIKGRIIRKLGMLFFEADERSQLVIPKSSPLIPHDESLRELKFYYYDTPVTKEEVEFIIKEDTKEIVMLFGLYLFHKK